MHRYIPVQKGQPYSTGTISVLHNTNFRTKFCSPHWPQFNCAVRDFPLSMTLATHWFQRYYRPQRSCEGYVSTGVCLSTGGAVPDQVPPPRPGTPPRRVTPPRPGTPPDQVHPPGPGTPPQTRYPPRPGMPPRTRYTPPRYGHCCGRYASYWNAFLFEIVCNVHFLASSLRNPCPCFQWHAWLIQAVTHH